MSTIHLWDHNAGKRTACGLFAHIKVRADAFKDCVDCLECIRSDLWNETEWAIEHMNPPAPEHWSDPEEGRRFWDDPDAGRRRLILGHEKELAARIDQLSREPANV